MATISYLCPACRRGLSADASREGLLHICPGCGVPTLVPAPEARVEGEPAPAVGGTGSVQERIAQSLRERQAKPAGPVRPDAAPVVRGAEARARREGGSGSVRQRSGVAGWVLAVLVLAALLGLGYWASERVREARRLGYEEGKAAAQAKGVAERREPVRPAAGAARPRAAMATVACPKCKGTGKRGSGFSGSATPRKCLNCGGDGQVPRGLVAEKE